jgi:hypothetical protein
MGRGVIEREPAVAAFVVGDAADQSGLDRAAPAGESGGRGELDVGRTAAIAGSVEMAPAAQAPRCCIMPPSNEFSTPLRSSSFH